MMTFKTILVDDEKLALDRLQRLLQPYQSILQIAGTASDGKEAVALIEEINPDLVFLDIQMPELNGFEVLSAITRRPWIIFTTAYDDYALQAFNTNSIDYLLKPIDKDRLAQAMEKLNRLQPADFQNRDRQLLSLLDFLEAKKTPQRLKIKLGDKIRFVDYSDIVFFQANEKYVEVHTTDDVHLIEDTIYQLEDQFKAQNFVRIHRSTLINMDYLLEVVKWFGGKYKVRMKDKNRTELTVSAGMKDNLGI